MAVKMKIIGENSVELEKPKIEILKLSASSMKTYDQCGLKYYYNYIAREKRLEWDHFQLGNLCHKALEIFHETYMEDGTSKKSLSKLMGYSFSEARKEFPDANNAILNEAKSLIENYLKVISDEGMPMVKGVETSFTFHLSEDILIRGFLDRVDIMKDGRFHILDYKTTKNTKYLDPFQLLVYGLWLTKEYPTVDSFKASYILLRHNSKLKSYEFNRKDIDRCKKKILDYADKINYSKEENHWTPVPGPLCNYCDFQKICPTQQSW